MSNKTVFISYRRDAAGRSFARSIKQELTHRGYDVFLDVDSIDAGEWEKQILTNIPKRAHFLLLLTPGALDRCVEEGDWLRREFLLAHQSKRNVVPVAEESVEIGAMRQAADPSMQAVFTYQIATIRHATFENDLDTLVERYIPPDKAPPEDDTPQPQSIPLDIGRVDKYAPTNLVGRDAELDQLNAAWQQATDGNNAARARVYTLVALGGEGKTSLVAHWLASLADQGWPGCQAAFAWSFYSQGASDQSAASGDLFLREALRFFGDPAMADSPAGAHEKGQRLAQLIQQRRGLLILDGLEPLQFAPTSPTPGLLKDQGVAVLLKSLAAQNPGLCVVTTRYKIADLNAYAAKGAPQVDLHSLSVEAGEDLLLKLGVTGSSKEFAALVKSVKGHALTLNLLGAYLRDAHGGDIRKADLIDLHEADDEEQGGHAFRVIAAYARWLEADGEKGQRALALLRLTGLFDRPADAGCLTALLQPPTIDGLTDALVNLSEAQRNIALTRLETAHLLTVNREADGKLISLDAHPLLREYFAAQLRDSQPEAWRAAHRRIYEHLCETTKEGEQPSLEALQPLYQAVAHGCWAEMQEEAMYEVYHARILRGDENYSAFKLGAITSDLGAIACFFAQPWRRLAPALSESAQAWLLNETAFCLRPLGRLNEALEPMRAGLDMGVKQENWKQAATRASNLSELGLTLGALNEALDDGALAVTYAEQSGDEFQRMGKRATHADALQQAGRADEAAALFREAETIQAKDQPAYPLLYSLAGFRYGEHLLAPAERAAWQTIIPPLAKGGLGGILTADHQALPLKSPPSPPFAKGGAKPPRHLHRRHPTRDADAPVGDPAKLAPRHRPRPPHPGPRRALCRAARRHFPRRHLPHPP